MPKINNYITNLPVYLENDYSNYIRKRERVDKVTELSKEFIDSYINNNNYIITNVKIDIITNYNKNRHSLIRDESPSTSGT